MAKLKITGVPPYDGEYEVPEGGWTNRELHYINQVCGVRAGELEEAMQAGDIGALTAITAVILKRAGHQVNIELLWDAKANESFDVVEDAEPQEDTDRPPATATAGGRKSEPDDAASASENGTSSGGSGAHAGDRSQPTPSPTGSPGSEDAVAFDLATSEN